MVRLHEHNGYQINGDLKHHDIMKTNSEKGVSDQAVSFAHYRGIMES